MILSHKYRFIFLKTIKTGGTSVELALSRICGPDDILAPLGAAEERKRRDTPPRNYKRGLAHWGIRLPGDVRSRFPALSGFYNHMPARQVRALIGDETWNSYYRFTVERNPWDRQVSLYFWRTRHWNPRPDFKAYLTSPRRRKFRTARLHNWRIYTIGDRLAVDRVIRFDHLGEDLADICRHLGIAGDVALPRAKGQSRTDVRPYQAFYDDETRDLVARWYAKEIAAFGYTF